MSMIKVEDLSFTYPGSWDAVFEHVSFTLDTGWRLGFIGRNGRGKTTFLNLLMGKYDYTGRIISSVAFDYFPGAVQHMERPAADVARELCPGAEDWRLSRELSLLGMDEGALGRPFCSLSNGERTRLLLSALFLNEDRFLLIDEPTNHLDAAGRRQAAEYLRGKRGYILVSHDRDFLDGCVDHVLSLNRADIDVQSGNFSSWFTNFQRRQSFEQAQNDSLKKDVARLKQAARRASDWSDRTESGKYDTRNSGLRADRGYVGSRAAAMMKRSKSIESRREKALEEREGLLKNAEETERLKLSPLTYRSERLLELSAAAPRYGGREVCAPVSFTLSRGARLALDGPNGSGKSSILKLILGGDTDHSGIVRLGSGLVVSHVPQDASFLRGKLADYARECGIDESLFKAILRKLDFERVQFEKDMADLSGGQKKKVLLARSLCERAHVYVWDEPLNYIDIFSRMQIESLLLEYAPTMIFVEHDGAFRRRIATETVTLTPPPPSY